VAAITAAVGEEAGAAAGGVGEVGAVAEAEEVVADSLQAAEVSAAVELAAVGKPMKIKHFLNQLEHDQVVKAIADAESKMCGEIRVLISRKQPGDPVRAAQESFFKLGMARTKMRNGVLIYIAPRSRKFAIIGDQAVHEKCGDAFWKEVADEMSAHFRGGDCTQAILHGIDRAGKLLAEHFPPQPGGENELSNEIAED
jgi:uncharacterized membrane protein